jgi:hypothetical protein
MHKKWLGIPVVAIIAVILGVGIVAAALLSTAHQTVTQVWTAPPPPPPSGTVTPSQTELVLPSMNYNTEFSGISEGSVTVVVNVPSTLNVIVDPGTFTEFGILLTCTTGNASNLEVSTYQDLTGSISLAAGTYSFNESAMGYTGSSGSGSASITFNLTTP